MKRTFPILLALVGVLTITEIASSQVSPGTPPSAASAADRSTP